MTYAYLRISTDKQFLENQKDAILNFAAKSDLVVDTWVTEIISGKVSKEGRKLGRLLKKAKKGDVIVVTEMSRLSRTLGEIMEIMSHCIKRGIILYSIKEGYSFDDSINSQVLCFAFGLAADIERRLISMRTKEALAARKAAGMKLGRRQGFCPKSLPLRKRMDEIADKLDADIAMEAIARSLSVSRATLVKFINEDPVLSVKYSERKSRRSK